MKPIYLGLALGLAALGCTDDGPGVHIGEGRAQLIQYQTCSSLEDDLKSMLIADVQTRYEQAKQWQGGGTDFGSSPPEAGAEGDSSNDDGRQEGVDYSGTNNQEDGVDEGDFVKTDGYNVYVLNGNRLHIYGVPEFGDLDPLSVTEIEGIPQEMLVNRDANRAVVFSMIYPWNLPQEHPLFDIIGDPVDEGGWYWRVNGLSKLTVFDITDRSNPVLERELFIEGYYQTARMADGSIRVASYADIIVPGHYDFYWYGEQSLEAARDAAIAKIHATSLEDIVPRLHERLPSGVVQTKPLTGDACRGFYRPGGSTGHGFTSLLSMNLFGSSMSFDADHIVSNWATVYASAENLYIAEPAHEWWWFWWNSDADQETNIHQFDIGTPGVATYRGSGRVAGYLLNQFSMSEWDDHLRVATTTDPWARWWENEPEVSKNHVYVLERQNGALQTVGHVGDIAPGERIFAARFTGDKGYLVTFVQTDPLFTLDLSSHENPKVIGELHIPGFSNYLHPLGDSHLIGFGVGGDETGANWRTQVSLFNVSDFANPTRDDALELALPGGWSWSEANWDHKAFQYWGPEKLLAVPVSSYSYDTDYQYISQLELVTVDPEAGLASYGSIDHSAFFNTDPNYYWDYRDIRRSIFMGDYVYAISDRGITVHNLAGLSTVHSEALPGADYQYYWWW